jgi:MFS family permease
MKRLCDLYIRNAGWIGAIFCAVPTIVWFAAMLLSIPFREVYLLRLGLCLAVGCPIAAYLNSYGVNAWLRKHRSQGGPATIVDGVLVGAAIGIGSALLPVLTALISTNHPEAAKTFIIVSYLSVTLVGAVMGAVLALVARKYVDRTPATGGYPAR